MINNQMEYLFHLCMEVQKGKDGSYEERYAEKSDRPTVFFEMSGHVACLYIRLYDRGWKPTMDSDREFEFHLDEEIDQDEFRACRDHLLKLIEEQKEVE